MYPVSASSGPNPGPKKRFLRTFGWSLLLPWDARRAPRWQVQPTSCGLESPLVGEPKWGSDCLLREAALPSRARDLALLVCAFFHSVPAPHTWFSPGPALLPERAWCGTASTSRTLEKDLWLLLVELRDYQPRGRASPASRGKNSAFIPPFLLSLSLSAWQLSHRKVTNGILRVGGSSGPESLAAFRFLFFFLFFLREAMEVCRAFYPSVLENLR